MSLSDWENAKENIVPLKGGRDPTKLSTFANKVNPEELEQEKQKFENIINEYQGDDPIDNWLKYIKWTQQSYPGGNMKEQLIILLERCTRLFINTEKYKNDPRYLRIWITYADMCRDPNEVFAFLENQRIGFYLSLIYEARAIVYENKGDYEKADKSFKQGIERKAQPIERLQQKHQDFERRLMARLKYQRDNNPDQLLQQQQQESSLLNDENNKSSNSRTILGTISTTHVSSERKSSQIKGQPLGVANLDKKRKINEQQKSNQSFQIFQDNSENNDVVQTDSKFFGQSRKVGTNPQINSVGGVLPQVKWSELEPELTKHKENTQLAQKWSDTKIPQKKLKTQNPSFQIYCDEDIQQPLNTSQSQDGNGENDTSDKLKLLSNVKQSKLEEIQNNPLANFTKINNNNNNNNNNIHNTSLQSSTANKSLLSSTNTTKNERIGYNKSLFINNENNHELSFEEVRLMSFIKASKEQKEKKEREEKERLEKELKEKEERERLEKELKEKELKERLEKEENERLENQKQQEEQQEQDDEDEEFFESSNREPTMTIHTKQAFNDVMAMFSEPLDFEQDIKKNKKHLSSPNPFSSKQPQQQQQEQQENVKITNRDILIKQLSSPEVNSQQQEEQQQQQQPQFITLDEDRDRVQTIERIDKFVKSQQFQIFEENHNQQQQSMFPSAFQSNNPNLLDKIKGKNKSNSTGGSGGFTIFQDPEPQQQQVPKKSLGGGFTIFQDSEQQQQPQQPQQQPKKSLGGGFAIFQDPEPMNSEPSQPQQQQPIEQEQKTLEFEKPINNNITFSASTFSVSTISPLSSKSMVMMDFNTNDKLDLESSFKSSAVSGNITSNITSNITGNITSNIDPTQVIICSLTPDDGIVNPYLVDHQYLLEQHVSGTVQSIESFINVSDDIAPIPENLEQVEINQSIEDNSIIIQMPFSDISISFSKCIAKSTIDGSTTFKVERIDDQATPEDSWLTCKIQDPSSIWEFYIVNQIHQRLSEQSSSSSSSSSMNPNSSGNITKNKFPIAHSLYYYTDKSIMLMDHFDQGTLVDVVASQPMDESLAMFHTIELLRSIEDLHGIGIIHGNICPKNLYFLFGSTSNWPDWSVDCQGAWSTKGFSLIDFSKSIDTTIYSKGAKFSSPLELLPSFISLEWFNANNNHQWCFNLDYFGICKIIFYILTGGKDDLLLSRNDDTGKLFITNQSRSLVNISQFSEFNSIWLPILEDLLNSSSNNGDNTINILKQQRELLENYLISNQLKSKSIKSLLRIQNIKLFESMKSK